jgi:ribose 5-phosphate isomerase B
VKIIIGSDHAGYQTKEVVKKVLLGHRIDPVDVGTHGEESCDYPDFGKIVAKRVSTGEFDRGILICGTGIGMSMVANRFPGVRAALCHDTYTAKMSRMHNDANILVIGGRIIGPGLAEEIVATWLDTSFEGGRHKGRIEKIENA